LYFIFFLNFVYFLFFAKYFAFFTGKDEYTSPAGQLITVCSWLTIKQVSLLLGHVVYRFPFSDEAPASAAQTLSLKLDHIYYPQEEENLEQESNRRGEERGKGVRGTARIGRVVEISFFFEGVCYFRMCLFSLLSEYWVASKMQVNFFTNYPMIWFFFSFLGRRERKRR
jgi:hypothetical protein